MPTHTAILWNVERLFRNTNSPVARALGAAGRTGWTLTHYKQKVRAIADVLRAASPTPPALLALIEVESATVVRDVVRAAGWTDLMDTKVEGEDLSGYDLALAYSSKLFALDGAPRSYNIQNRFSTRDILDVPLRTRKTGHPLRVVHNHWPSRKVIDAGPLRLSAADYASRLIERHLKLSPEDLLGRARVELPKTAVLEARWDTPVLVIGDFNDNPYDASLGRLVASTRDRAEAASDRGFPKGRGKAAALRYLGMQPRLYNPTWRLLTEPPREGTKARATTRYATEWLLLDQVLCSRGLLIPGEGVRYVDGSLRVFGPRFVGTGARRRSLTGANGAPSAFESATDVGVSDHLPLVWDMHIP